MKFPANLKAEFIKVGLGRELLLSSLLGADLSSQEDDFSGVDIELNITIDVKGQKKVRRSDDSMSDQYHWIELRKNDTTPGWVCQGAMFIAFEMPTSWVIVDRQRLFDFIKYYIQDEYVESPEPFKKYRRNQSILTLVPVEHLRDIQLMEIEK